MSEGPEAIFFLSFSFFLVGSVGDVSRVLLACVLHALGTNPAFPGASWIFIPKNKTLMLPKFIQICLNLTCSSVKQGSCLQSCSSWASFPLRCLLIGSAPRFRPFFFVTSSSPIVQWEFRMGVSEFSSSIMCFVLVEGGR